MVLSECCEESGIESIEGIVYMFNGVMMVEVVSVGGCGKRMEYGNSVSLKETLRAT